MAPSIRPSKNRDDEDYYEIKGDRKARKPLVEKKRRARINESLQELRLLVPGEDGENAEVLELTVKTCPGYICRAELAVNTDRLHREASERFAAGYIQCMHEVHTFVSSCRAIDATIAAELLNQLLESRPLNEGSFQDDVDVLADSAAGLEELYSSSSTALSPSPASEDSSCSDLEGEAEGEQITGSSLPLDTAGTQEVPSNSFSKSMWRPW
ncbi:LOW QUALITY PROTEIN: transcription cofactor HES-6-like [Rhinatrema bivittatum]|uniref:LOW QUALITY PROTEIN: transcription cofactor HES-6-like n=1 Tax=Rhinatrema bivittatum TaxID=194408 RepID=UPI00112E0D2F|nr:LOW QUALITY PROTEIN: transcription cofactor HES-6-like [Rhinatrema bivittatum]